MSNLLKKLFLVLLLVAPFPGLAAEELVTVNAANYDAAVPYILNYRNLTPKFVVILFPGGDGNLNPRIEDGQLVYAQKGNFLLRTRKLLVDDEFVTVATNSSQSPQRIQVILDDLNKRFPGAPIYLMGTSNGTIDTIELAGYLSDKIAGEIHTSSRSRVSSFDTRQYRNRHLLVHHKQDSCHVTPFSAAQAAHDKYGTELIVMEGGESKGDACGPHAHHGYQGIEGRTIASIKQWIKQGAVKN